MSGKHSNDYDEYKIKKTYNMEDAEYAKRKNINKKKKNKKNKNKALKISGIILLIIVLLIIGIVVKCNK